MHASLASQDETTTLVKKRYRQRSPFIIKIIILILFFYNSINMHQYVSVSLSLLGLCGIVGAGVAIGSGVGMMALNVAQQEEEQQNTIQGTKMTAAHSPVENRASFASSGVAATKC